MEAFGNVVCLPKLYLQTREQFVRINNEDQIKHKLAEEYHKNQSLVNLFLDFHKWPTRQNAKLESYGCAHDFKLVAMRNQDLNAYAEQLDIWRYKNGKETNKSKCNFLKIKGSMITSLNNIKLEATHVPKT